MKRRRGEETRLTYALRRGEREKERERRFIRAGDRKAPPEEGNRWRRA